MVMPDFTQSTDAASPVPPATSPFGTEVGELLFSLQALLIREAEGAPDALLHAELDAEPWIGDAAAPLAGVAAAGGDGGSQAPAENAGTPITPMFGRPAEPAPELWDASTGAATVHALDREIALRGSRVSGALVTLDISPLAEIRSQHGEAAAEGVLRAVVEAVPFAMRAEDQVFRTGVDELTLYVPRASLADAAGMALRLQLAVKDVLVRRELPPVMLSVRPSQRAAA